jgi:hypothetical protein
LSGEHPSVVAFVLFVLDCLEQSSVAFVSVCVLNFLGSRSSVAFISVFVPVNVWEAGPLLLVYMFSPSCLAAQCHLPPRLKAELSCTAVRVGQNQTYIYIHIYGVHVLQLGLAKTIHIYTVCIYCIFSREIAIHVYVYTVCICGIFRR